MRLSLCLNFCKAVRWFLAYINYSKRIISKTRKYFRGYKTKYHMLSSIRSYGLWYHVEPFICFYHQNTSGSFQNSVQVMSEAVKNCVLWWELDLNQIAKKISPHPLRWWFCCNFPLCLKQLSFRHYDFFLDCIWRTMFLE